MNNDRRAALIEEVEMKEHEHYSALSCIICHKEAMIHTTSEYLLRNLGVETIILCKECGGIIRQSMLGPDVPETPALTKQMALLKEIHREYDVIAKQGKPKGLMDFMQLLMRIETMAAVIEALNHEIADLVKDLAIKQGMPSGEMSPPFPFQ